MSTRPSSALSLSPDDVIFALSRHKKKIILAVFLGLAAAGGLYATQKPTYTSKAKLMVRYVMETRTLAPVGAMRQIKDTDQGAQSLINSELEILTSQDLFKGIVTEVGPEKILGPTSITNTFNSAVTKVVTGLKVQVTPRSEVINISFQHGDPDVARDVLTSLIRLYQQKHSDVHRTSQGLTYLAEQTDAVKQRLAQNEEALQRALTDAGVSSLPEAKLEVASRIATLRRDISLQEAELAAEEATFASMGLQSSAGGTNPAPAAMSGESATATNEIGANGIGQLASLETNAVTENASSLPYDTALYNQILGRIADLRLREIELLGSYTSNSQPVMHLRGQVAELNKMLAAMRPPGLVQQGAAPSHFVSAAPMISTPVINRAPGIKARLETLREQLRLAQEESRRIDSKENNIRQIQRQNEVDEGNFKYFQAALEQAKIDSNLSSGGGLNNISVIQNPSIASRAATESLAVIAAGGLPIGLALLYAFVIELLMPRGYARPKDIETSLKLPLIGVIPKLKTARRGSLPKNGELKALPAPGANGLEVAPWDETDPMADYYDALRDRVVMSYDGDTHKPKIVGVTSCNSGAGVSRLATGLAAALSRDVQREVLYISLEKNKVALSSFTKGRPTALESNHLNGSEEPENGYALEPIRQNLLSLARTGRNLMGASAVQSFCDLIPNLKSCDYDYIIFDLPPLSQTSGSLRLASQMERTLLVVEADVTARDKTQRAVKLLANGRANIAAVLNKVKGQDPVKLDDEI